MIIQVEPYFAHNSFVTGYQYYPDTPDGKNLWITMVETYLDLNVHLEDIIIETVYTHPTTGETRQYHYNAQTVQHIEDNVWVVGVLI